MDTVQLKLKLIESERTYHDRFFKFIEILKRAAEGNELFKQAKTKTILKISQEVLKCSEDLLLVLENRRRISHQSETIYKELETNHRQAVGILSSYCTHLLDIRALLRSSTGVGCSELQLSRLMQEALQPVHHVEAILGLLREINEHLVASRRLVEIFSCNSLIDHFTKGLERARRAIASLQADELLLTLEDISAKDDSDIDLSAIAPASLTKDSKAGNTGKPFATVSHTELSPTASRNKEELGSQNGAVDSLCDVQPTGKQDANFPESANETLTWPAKSQRAGTQLVEERLEIPENVVAAVSLADQVDEDVNKKDSDTKMFASRQELGSPTESEDPQAELGSKNEAAVSECDGEEIIKEIDNENLRIDNKSLHHSTQTQSIGSQDVELRQLDMPKETHPKKKPPIPSPRTRSTVNSVQKDNVSLKRDDVIKSLQPELLRRESKKLIRSEVQSIAMKIAALRGDISSLEKKLDRLDSSGSSASSDGTTTKDLEDFPEVFEDSEHVTGPCPAVDTTSSGVVLRSESMYYDAGLRDRRTKHLLHSTIWQVPLYQEYHVDVNADSDDAHGLEGETREENLLEAKAANIVNDLDGGSRPESGIEVEGDVEGEAGGEEEGEETVGCYYTPMWNNGSGLEECGRESPAYTTMNGIRNYDISSSSSLTPYPKKNASKWESTDDCSSPSRESTLNYMDMCRTYANVCQGISHDTQSESIYNSVRDIFGAVEKESAGQEEACRGEVPHFVPATRAKQLPGWCNIPAVRDSGLLELMTKRERHFLEAKYELISSKVSYLKSLSILQAVFIENVDLKQLMSSTEWNNLFQYIGPIKKCSEHFLADLLSGWPQDIFMKNQLLVVRQYALTGLQTYVNYCSNKVTIDKTLANIRANNPKVNNALKKLEGDEICDNNTLESFLVLPIQRITRFPLLVEGILKRMDPNTDNDFCAWAKTYRELEKMAKQCNDAVKVFDEANERPVERSHDVNTIKTLPSKTRLSTAFRKQSKSSTLPKRLGSAVWHDSDGC